MACSSSEAEYIGISEIVKQILFIRQILVFLNLPVEYPVYVNIDKIGAIHMAEGSEGKRTKHIDIKYHFVREYTENGIVKIIFVKSADKKADTFTKNTGSELFEKHHGEYMQEISEWECWIYVYVWKLYGLESLKTWEGVKEW